jgi:uncharacterized membrane protein YeaQ/YmgE (transglycosylase-associated protein family)
MALEILSWIIVGILFGSFARAAMPGPAAGGMFVAVLIGLLGALTGGFLGATFVEKTSGPINIASLMMAMNGAIYPLFLYRCLAMRLHEPIRVPVGKR